MAFFSPSVFQLRTLNIQGDSLVLVDSSKTKSPDYYSLRSEVRMLYVFQVAKRYSQFDLK